MHRTTPYRTVPCLGDGDGLDLDPLHNTGVNGGVGEALVEGARESSGVGALVKGNMG